MAKIELTLFFTYGVSLKTWADTGLIDREILIYKRLAHREVRVTFITYGDKEDYEYCDKLGDIEIVPFYAYTSKPASKILAIIHSLLLPFVLRAKIKKADILKTNQMWGSWVALLSKFLYRKKLIVRCGVERYKNALQRNHHPLYLLLLKWLSKFSYKYADRIILTSESIVEFVVSQMRADQQKIALISNYIDIALFKPMDLAENVKLLFIGRLSEPKNIFSLLDAVSQTDYEMDIIGDGELRTEIDAYIKTHNIRVNLLGRFPNAQLPEIINCYPVYVLPSYYEGNPKALLEAMACGIAVIGTSVDGIKEIIKDGENGILCHTDASSIRQAIVALMHDKTRRARLGRNARKFVVENCNLDVIAGKEYNVHDEMLSQDT